MSTKDLKHLEHTRPFMHSAVDWHTNEPGIQIRTPLCMQLGLEPTGRLAPLVRSSGFTNTHDFLIYQATGESAEAIAARKARHAWGLWTRPEREEACRGGPEGGGSGMAATGGGTQGWLRGGGKACRNSSRHWPRRTSVQVRLIQQQHAAAIGSVTQTTCTLDVPFSSSCIPTIPACDSDDFLSIPQKRLAHPHKAHPVFPSVGSLFAQRPCSSEDASADGSDGLLRGNVERINSGLGDGSTGSLSRDGSLRGVSRDDRGHANRGGSADRGNAAQG
eukprot:scaffold296303_cov24-Tisochrysis_lutea.AAC.1